MRTVYVVQSSLGSSKVLFDTIEQATGFIKDDAEAYNTESIVGESYTMTAEHISEKDYQKAVKNEFDEW